MAAIDTLSNRVIATIPVGQAPQALTYVPNAVPEGDGMQNLQSLGVGGNVVHLALAPGGRKGDKAPTNVSLFDQGLTQVLQASVTGLEAKHPYVLALAERADGSGMLDPLASFMTNPAGAAIVNAVGPVRQIVRGGTAAPRHYLVIVPGPATTPGRPVQVQVP